MIRARLRARLRAALLRHLANVSGPGIVRVRMLRRLGLAVGEGTVIRSGCRFTGPDVSIGSRCFINFGVTFDATAPISIADDVEIALEVAIVTASHDIAPSSNHRVGRWAPVPVRIEQGCWLGARCVVLPGVTIGRGCVIGAGAVVASDCDPNGMYVGVPARRIRELATADGGRARVSSR